MILLPSEPDKGPAIVEALRKDGFTVSARTRANGLVVVSVVCRKPQRTKVLELATDIDQGVRTAH